MRHAKKIESVGITGVISGRDVSLGRAFLSSNNEDVTQGLACLLIAQTCAAANCPLVEKDEIKGPVTAHSMLLPGPPLPLVLTLTYRSF